MPTSAHPEEARRAVSKDHSKPVNEADRQARAAVRAAVNECFGGSYARFAGAFNLSTATAKAVYAGQRDVPPGLARELAAGLREAAPLERHGATLRDHAATLDLWADDCALRAVEESVAEMDSDQRAALLKGDFGDG